MAVLKILLGVCLIFVVGVVSAYYGGSCGCHVPPATYKPPNPPKG